ncbi:MAG: polyprenyl synthetase family protein [Longimonas sp.]|uniref:polyprenyl synthetase family protein n=1 Tax=Longimonas sp. TaxID=2039626 RepID=UPI00336317E8
MSDFVPVDTLRRRCDAALSTLVAGRKPDVLYAPIRYVLNGGGKRVRPVLVQLTAQTYGVAPNVSEPVALAAEVFHNFTLVHDDIMDAAPERRGRPTVHTKWDESTAILAGDWLMGCATRLLCDAEAPTEDLLDVYHPMVNALCEGQALDTDFETRAEVSVDAYMRMIDGKTGALLAACMAWGGVIGGASPETREQLHDAGMAIGRAFQIQDDLLDVIADHDDWGKAVGGDLQAGKKTFVTLMALERASGATHRMLKRTLFEEGGCPPDQIEAVQKTMQDLGVFEAARGAVARYTEAAHGALDILPEGPARMALLDLLNQLQERAY